MIFYHADDYGINPEQSERILYCNSHGALNSVSIMPNSDHLAETVPLIPETVSRSIHINLCEGHCVSPADQVALLVDKNGEFNRSFSELLLMSVVKRKTVFQQIKTECSGQINRVMDLTGKNKPVRIDSHRHYHMIPAVFRALYEITEENGIEVDYVRWPVEPIALYRKDGIGRLSPVNIVKCAVLWALGKADSGIRKKWKQNRKALFCGVLYTGRMFYENVAPVLDAFKDKAAEEGLDLEVLFHPGGVKEGEQHISETVGFHAYYESEDRDREGEALIKLGKTV